MERYVSTNTSTVAKNTTHPQRDENGLPVAIFKRGFRNQNTFIQKIHTEDRERGAGESNDFTDVGKKKTETSVFTRYC